MGSLILMMILKRCARECAHFGENDTAITVDTVGVFQAMLQTNNGKHEVYIYSNVGYGFVNYRGGDNITCNKEASNTALKKNTRIF